MMSLFNLCKRINEYEEGIHNGIKRYAEQVCVRIIVIDDYGTFVDQLRERVIVIYGNEHYINTETGLKIRAQGKRAFVKEIINHTFNNMNEFSDYICNMSIMENKLMFPFYIPIKHVFGQGFMKPIFGCIHMIETGS